MIDNNTLVTVIVLIYKNYSNIRNTVHSILVQDYLNLEIIISDDATPGGSEDNIWSELGDLSENQKQRIKVIIQPVNLGIVAHANKIASISKGKYLKFIPPGDRFCYVHALHDLVEAMERSNAQVVTSPALVQNIITGQVAYQFPPKYQLQKLIGTSNKDIFEILARANIISAVGTIYSREFFDYGGFDCSYRYLDDWPTWLRMSRENNKIGILCTPTVYYSVEGISNQFGNAFESELLHKDLLLCYEKEILPYQSRLNMLTRYIVNYYYGILLGKRNILFRIQYIPMNLYYEIKKYIKRLVVTGKSNKTFLYRVLKYFGWF